MQHALIWGAAGGIGGALAAALREADWHVLAVARDTAALDAQGYDAYPADLTRPADVAAAALWAAQQSGGVVQRWFFAAGDMYGGALADTPHADFERIVAANLTAAHTAVTQSLALVPSGGALVFIGAYADRIMLPKLGAYAAAKAALDAYVTVLGKELRDRRVLNMRLGAVDTSLWRKAPFKLPRGAYQPAEVAAAVLQALDEGRRGNVDL